ncbi:MAG: oligosaccharide flippase family protein [Oscillospiraceae bacterium]|jgi:stage V sporulation protein B|nr:oligosaccharide flippase family protein [Oscillospiraceae bacterium]
MNKIAKDTMLLTFVNLFLQALGLLLNIYITKTLGSTNVGIVTLIATFYYLSAVLAGGNIFICTNRLVSVELANNGNPQKIFSYAVIFCLSLSFTVTGMIFVFSDEIALNLIKIPQALWAIRILALSLPIGTLSNCVKGYFQAHRNILLPSMIDCVSFLIRIAVIVMLIQFCVIMRGMSIFLAFALSVTISTSAECILIVIAFCKQNVHCDKKVTINFKTFMAIAIPIALNSYIIASLSSANDALIPLTLKQFGESTGDALSKFGIFEAIVLPTLFFPSVIVQCLSCILLPEISKASASGNTVRVQHLTKKALQRTLYFSMLIMVILLCFGNKIGMMLSDEKIAGEVITILSPVIPLIYLEIVLEGILRGLGKYSFSTFNYIAEYIVRISVLLICVPLFGFYGLVISYILSNVVGNVSRIRNIDKIINVKFREVLFA